MPSLFQGDWWIGSEICTMPFSDLQDAKIGVEASHYLQHMIDEPPAHEPLLAALGGDPMSLKNCIKLELDQWKQNGMTPLFVFEGQSIVGKDNITLRDAKAALVKTENAWSNYTDGDSMGAVKLFGLSGAARVTDFYPILQAILDERGLEYIIAPYSACAQLAYLEGLPEPYIDGIMGSQELLLYDINDAIIMPPSSTDWEKKILSGIIKSDLIRKLGVTPELFSDALLMLGTSFLRPFPTLLDETIITNQPYQIRDAVNLLRTSERSITSLCTTFHDVIQARDPGWLDNFRKAKMGIKHCVTAAVDGSTHIREFNNLTGDNHEYLGLQLPPELYHYLTQAVVGPRLLNIFGSLEILTFPTLDGVLSDEYKKLVTKQLVPIKEQTVALLTPRIHRGIKYKAITLRFWFDEKLQPTLNRDLRVEPNSQADTWAVRAPELKRQATATKTTPGKLSFALLALDDKDFSAKTIFKPKDYNDRITDLKLDGEVISNVLWRLLHLRGYINDKHELTSWGKALQVTLKALQPTVKKFGEIHHIEEAAFLAYELIRFDHLNTRNQHREIIGGSIRGSEEDKASCMLIGRTACLLKLRHQENGYTGPLSKVFLAFHSIIKTIRETDRDLMEAAVASMFLSGQINREKSNFSDLGRSMPLSSNIDVGLGIAVKTFLDDCVKPEMSAEEKDKAKSTYAEGKALLPLSVNFVEDLDVAFGFFDALHEGVKTLDKDIEEADKKAWDAAKEYLDKRR